jgi:addiction module HigA family antidote
MAKAKLAPIHPGEILKTVLDDASLNAHRVARSLRIPTNRLTAILSGRRSIAADTAMRLARFFGTSAEMWINLQARVAPRQSLTGWLFRAIRWRVRFLPNGRLQTEADGTESLTDRSRQL